MSSPLGDPGTPAIIESSDSDPNTPDGRTAFFVYAGQAEWQLIEEYAAGDDMTADRSYVYGLSIDEVLSMRDQVGDDYYYHQDDLFSVYAMTDDAGNVVERYAYGDYGQVSVTAEDGSPRAGSAGRHWPLLRQCVSHPASHWLASSQWHPGHPGQSALPDSQSRR
jgi:hypothetical protein